jgi:hypothetical protein
VEAIVFKSLEKAKVRRYASANELGADIRNYLADRPISARAPTTWYFLSKFARRHRDPPEVYANITNPNPSFPIQWVRVFHSEFGDGVLDMKPPINAYEDPDGWVATLPKGWVYPNLKVVAYVRPGVWSQVQLTDQDVTQAVRYGTVTVQAGVSNSFPPIRWDTSSLDFDADSKDATASWSQYNSPYVPGLPWDITHFLASDTWRLHLSELHEKTTEPFEDIDPGFINAELVANRVDGPPGDYLYAKDDVFILVSAKGYLVKFRIASISDSGLLRRLTLEYVVYNP